MLEAITSKYNKEINTTLAILGGQAIRLRSWPQWPQAKSETGEYLLDVLHSGRWSIGGKYTGTLLYARRFSSAFAQYHQVSHCLPVVNGSAALVIALEALAVQPGDEVLVPGLAWVSCASSVTRIGAIPILVDIDPTTLCMSVTEARKAISSRTKAIVLVHSYCTVADLDAFTQLSEESQIPLVEDCSQAHGATWRKRRVGSFGKIGVFSMGQSKVLSCGEGGAAITDDAYLYDRMQQFHGDGYQYITKPSIIGESELEEVGAVQGHNYCISEFQSAILLAQFKYLDEQNQHRESNGEYLRQLLMNIEGVEPLHRAPQIDNLTYFRFCVRINLDAFGGASIDQIRRALSAELNETSLELVDSPLNNYKLYNPLQPLGSQYALTSAHVLNPAQFQLPFATTARIECLTLHHAMLLGTKSDMDDIAAAFVKIKKNSEALLDV